MLSPSSNHHEDESFEPLLNENPVSQDFSSVNIEEIVKTASDSIQKLSHFNHQIESEITKLVRREVVGSRGRHNIHDLIASATNLSYQIGKQLDPKITAGTAMKNSQYLRIIDKLRVGFAREVKKLNQLGKDLAAQERKMVVIAQMDNANDLLQDNPQRRKDDSSAGEEIQVQMHVMDPDLQLLNQRQAAMQEINRDVRLLNEMMLDLAYLVEEQQEMVDHISMNVDNSKVAVEHAEEELITASRYQRQSRSRWCCFLLLLTAFLSVLVLIVYLFAS